VDANGFFDFPSICEEFMRRSFAQSSMFMHKSMRCFDFTIIADGVSKKMRVGT
jgi:hypothetical protein